VGATRVGKTQDSTFLARLMSLKEGETRVGNNIRLADFKWLPSSGKILN